MMTNQSEALAQQNVQPDPADMPTTSQEENNDQDRFYDEDDLHEIQVDDDLNEPDPEDIDTED